MEIYYACFKRLKQLNVTTIDTKKTPFDVFLVACGIDDRCDYDLSAYIDNEDFNRAFVMFVIQPFEGKHSTSHPVDRPTLVDTKPSGRWCSDHLHDLNQPTSTRIP